MGYCNIQTIRYMGNKNKLLDLIIPEIENITNPGDLVCDLMAGTSSIGYALKERNKIIANDIQFYSFVIGKCLLGNYKIPTQEEIHNDIDENFKLNLQEKTFNFFEKFYTDTYFSGPQCCEIDSLRFAIDKISGEKHYFYLVLLMNAMCKAQSSPGHFAQFMDKNHKRLIPIRALKIYDLFFEKVNDFADFRVSKFDNEVYNLDFNVLLADKEKIKGVKCFYLDSPYTNDQYSRFYHVLETICKYDSPLLTAKAKYRENRFMSEFCYKKSVGDGFEKIIKASVENNSNLVISYSNHGVLSVEELKLICEKYYKNVELKKFDYNHSSQGSGTIQIKEVLFILTGGPKE